MRKYILAYCIATVCLPVHAFSCFFTAVKDRCWLNYEVTVNVEDVKDKKSILSIVIPKGKLWQRQKFSCEKGQKIFYSATFQPTIWKGHDNMVYHAQHFWALPDTIPTHEKAWNIPVCFPEAFAEVPEPASSGSNCACDMKSIPAPEL